MDELEVSVGVYNLYKIKSQRMIQHHDIKAKKCVEISHFTSSDLMTFLNG